jgi:CHASE2 domain-containing sensor protein
MRFSLRSPPPEARDGLLLVTLDRQFAIDHKAAQARPRATDTKLVGLLSRAGARLVVFDFDFATPSQTGDDQAFEAAIKRAGNVAYGFSEVAAKPVAHAGQFVLFGQWGPQLARRLGLTVGSVITSEPIRRLTYDVRYETKPARSWPTLAVAAAQAVTGRPVARERFGSDGAWIDYAGPPGTIPRVSLADVLDGRIAPGRFRGKVVLIGTDNPLVDQHETSASSSRMAGVEVVANQLNTVLRGLPLQEMSALAAGLWIYLLALVAPIAALCLRPSRAALAAAITLLGYVGLTQFEFDRGLILPAVAPVFAFVLSTVLVLALAHVRVARDRQRLRRRFARMDDDAIAEVLRPARGRRRSKGSSTSIVAGYRIEEPIGHGGMGAVYRATQLDLGREVALKVIRDEHAADPRYRERFVRESRMAAAADHPNVIPIYEAGDDNGLLFIAMRLVSGVDLESRLRHGGPLAPVEAVKTVQQLAAAVHAAHEVGLVHRDVKPANVLLTDDVPMHVYLTDFGVARFVETGGAIDERPVGTAAYMAPEQISGPAASAQTDVYALGGVLVAAMTGAPPYPHESETETLAAHLHSDPPRLSGCVDGVTKELDRVIACALAKDPEERYASALDFGRATGLALDGEFVAPGRGPAAAHAEPARRSTPRAATIVE